MSQIRFSIIVVAYNNENFIEQCLYSCLFDGRGDHEVIVVCNRSEDRTPDLIRRIRDAFPHIFRIIENSANLGLGEARNIGLGAAKGEYVLFLDGDDWFDAAVGRRLGELLSGRSVDVCLFSHIRVYESFQRKANRHQRLLWEGYRDSPRKRAQVMPNLGVAWNKAYRRSFLTERGLRFASGYYEDVFLNFYVILFAETFYVIPDALLYYRQRSGSITCTADSGHFSIFGEYARLITLLSEHRQLIPPYGEAIYQYARSQILNVLHDGRRIPKGMEQAYVGQAGKLLQEFRRLLGLPEGRNQWLREKVLGWESYHCYMLGHQALKKITRYSRKLRKRCAGYLEALLSPVWWGNLFMAPVYRHFLARFLPVEEKTILFESGRGERMGGSPHTLALALREQGYDCVWSLKKPPQGENGQGFRLVRPQGWEYWKTAAGAKYFVSDANFPDALVKRPGQIHLRIPDGSPLRLAGGDRLRTRQWDDQWKTYAANCKRWDFLLSASRYATRIWRQAAPYSYQVLESGYPANDIFFGEAKEARAQAMRERLAIPPSAGVALYCPAARDYPGGSSPFAEDIFDLRRVKDALGDDHVLLLHAEAPRMAASLKLPPGVYTADKGTDFADLAAAADILITDYASVVFDFACLNRPIIVYCYDYEEFVAARGLYFDIRDKAPGVVAHNQEELLACLREKSFREPEVIAKARAFRKEFCEFDDGKAARRVLEAVFGI